MRSGLYILQGKCDILDRIIRCITSDGCVMASAAETSDLVLTAQAIHKASPVAAAALGRLLTGAALMGDQLKGEDASITLRIDGGGPLGPVVAVADSRGNSRGYVTNPDVSLPLQKTGKLDVGAAVGKEGTFRVMRDLGSGEPYMGQIPIASGEIAEDITAYYAKSEQIPTVCSLGVLVGKEDHLVKLAGGLLIQLLPAATEDSICTLEAALAQLEPMTEMLAKGMTIEDICQKALAGFQVEKLDENPIGYVCYCSKEKVQNALSMLPVQELREMAEKDNGAQASCQFCGKSYWIPKQELLSLAESRGKKI